MENRIRIGISACLLGQPVRFDGSHKHDRYITGTLEKNMNVLQHIMGYFKQQLTADEKQELLEVLDQYRKEYLPLIVPITLMNHYVRKYDQPYLKQQVYLNPHPVALKLRNHA